MILAAVENLFGMKQNMSNVSMFLECNESIGAGIGHGSKYALLAIVAHKPPM